jgi:transketolase
VCSIFTVKFVSCALPTFAAVAYILCCLLLLPLQGIVAFGGLVPYCGTFLNFFGYSAGAVRVTALSHFRVIYVGTHDSIGLGEDGPTHQPVEMLEMLRAMPNMFVYRPADGNEVSGVLLCRGRCRSFSSSALLPATLTLPLQVSAAYACALQNSHAPAVVALSRQNLPQLPSSSIEKAMRGGYVAYDTADASGAPEAAAAVTTPVALNIVATGSEVCIAVEGAKKIAAASGVRVRVVSVPCTEIFEAQPVEYRKEVLPDGVPVLSIEAAAIRGWERYAHQSIGMTTFGLSAPGPVGAGVGRARLCVCVCVCVVCVCVCVCGRQ